MNRYTPGARVTIVETVADPFTRAAPGQPADVDGFLLVDDSTEAVTIWRPNGALFTPSPTATHVSIGIYHFTFLIPSATAPYPDSSLYGVWSYQTSSSMTAQGDSEIGTFLVSPTPS
jgi:hypothetical protein